MLIRIFLCGWELHEGGWGSYIRHRYVVLHAQMRINRKYCLVAIKSEDVPAGLEHDLNIEEIFYESKAVIPTEARSLIGEKLGVTVTKGTTNKDLFQKVIRRGDLDFDLIRLKQYLGANQSIHIDLINREMDL